MKWKRSKKGADSSAGNKKENGTASTASTRSTSTPDYDAKSQPSSNSSSHGMPPTNTSLTDRDRERKGSDMNCSNTKTSRARTPDGQGPLNLKPGQMALNNNGTGMLATTAVTTCKGDTVSVSPHPAVSAWSRLSLSGECGRSLSAQPVANPAASKQLQDPFYRSYVS